MQAKALTAEIANIQADLDSFGQPMLVKT